MNLFTRLRALLSPAKRVPVSVRISCQCGKLDHSLSVMISTSEAAMLPEDPSKKLIVEGCPTQSPEFWEIHKEEVARQGYVIVTSI